MTNLGEVDMTVMYDPVHDIMHKCATIVITDEENKIDDLECTRFNSYKVNSLHLLKLVLMMLL